MDFWKDIWEWGVAVFEHWHGYVSGTILAFAFEWGEKLKLWEWKPPKKWLIAILIAGFLASIYAAWHEEHEKRLKAEKQLEFLTMPNLVLTPNQLVTGDSVQGLSVLVEATIKNLGAPIAVSGYQIRAQGPDFDTGRINPIFIPEGFTVWNGVMKIAVFHKDMLLQEKAAHAIQRGDQVGGWIRFILPMNTAQLKSGKTTLTLYFSDINGKEYNYSSDQLPPQGPTYSPATGASPFVFPVDEVKPKP